MDYLQEAKDFAEYACERMDQGKYDRSVMDRELAKTYALIALVERLDCLSYQDGHDPDRRRFRVNVTGT